MKIEKEEYEMATRKDLDLFLTKCQISSGHLKAIQCRLDAIAPNPEEEINEATIKNIFEGLPDLFKAFMAQAPVST